MKAPPGNMIRRLRPALTMAIALFALLRSTHATALDLTQSLKQFHHTAWTLREGGPGAVTAIAQSSDGYLWLGTPNGLYRFDGARFDLIEALGGTRLLSNNIFSLVATQDGGLWVGYTPGGASFIRGEQMRNYGVSEGLPDHTVYQFAAAEGDVWAITNQGPRRFDGERWQAPGKDETFPEGDGTGFSIVFDRARNLWVGTQQGVFFRSHRERKFQQISMEGLRFCQFALAPDDRVWVSDPVSVRGTRPLPQPGTTASWQDKWWPANPRMFVPLWDHDGALWFGATEGLQRWILSTTPSSRGVVAQPRVETFGTEQGLSGDFIRAVFEDREGTIWVGTNGGLDRFRPNKLDIVELPGRSERILLAAAPDGAVWLNGYYRGLFQLSDAGSRSLLTEPNQVTAMFRDTGGVLWLGDIGGVSRYDGLRATRLANPNQADLLDGEIQALVTDESGALWVGLAHGDPALFRVANGVWTAYGGISDLPRDGPLTIIKDSMATMWFGYPNLIVRLRKGHAEAFGSDKGVMLGSVTALASRRERVWAGGEFGLAFFDGSRFQMVSARGMDRLSGISGLVASESGDLWLNGSDGITHVPAAEVDRAIADPAYQVSYERFDRLDGLMGTPEQLRPLPTAVEATDGQIWFALTNGVVKIDPKRTRRNEIVPTVLVQSVLAGGHTYLGEDTLSLPVGVASVQFNYTATSLAIPERVNFRYMLEGLDERWVEAAQRRQAFYTNLRPGSYRFRVVASNDGGVWNENGASIGIEVPPAFYQTRWFAALCVVVSACAIWTWYHLRVRQLARALKARFDERLAERTRIARNLHDTLLQTIQGSKLVVDDALEQPEDHTRTRRAVEQLSVWLQQAIEEGRAALASLRASSSATFDLVDALKCLSERAGNQDGIRVSFSVIGDRRDVPWLVTEEVCQITEEAVRNARAHSHGLRLEVELRYAQDLAVRVSDDGVGMEPSVVERGRDGHFGLQGMRERAHRIGGKLTVLSSPGSGTEITIVVPGRIAFGKWHGTVEPN